MLCPDDSRVAAFVAGDLPPQARGVLEEHIDDCATCRQLIAGLVREGGGPWREGTRVGRYVIGERIGKGGMGAVYCAHDTELHRQVAIKRLHADDARARDRLLREARASAQLQHPNVVAVYEVVDGARPYLAMELVEGVTLTEWLRERPRHWREIVAIVGQAGRGLAAAHARGLVHGDFKPDNVLVDTDGRARVADFGLASVHASEVDPASSVAGAGTPAFMAPELVDGAAPDAKSDQYAFAVALFEALHGAHPFAGATAEAIWTEMALGRIRTVHDPARPRVPAWLEKCVRKGLAADRAERWPDVATFVGALDRRRPRKVAFAAAALAGFAVASLAWLVAPRATDDCAKGADLIDGLWSAPLRDAQRVRFLALRPNAAVSIDAAGQQIDAWTTAWKLGRRAACASDERTHRIACLDRELHELRAQLAVWATADADVVDNVVRAASGLASPEACIAPSQLTELDPGIRSQLADFDALVRSGKVKTARARADALLAAATKAGKPRELAAALLSVANAELEVGELEQAREHFAQASRSAGVANDDRVMIEAVIREATVLLELGRPRDSLELLEVAEAIDARAAQHRYTDIALARGDALNEAGRPAEAAATLRGIVAPLEAMAARDRSYRSRLGGLYAQLAQAQLAQDDREGGVAMLRRALAADEATYGPEHPEVAKQLHDLAYAEIQLHRFADARAHLDRAIAITKAAFGEHHVLIGSCYLVAAKLELYAGNPDEARAANLRALDALTGALPPDHPSFGAIEANLGEIDRDADHCKDAIPHLERAVAILEKNGNDPKSHAQQLSSLGSCQADVGQRAAARRTMEQALAEMTANQVGPRWFSEPYAVLADLEFAEHHVAKAIELERKALAVLEGVPGDDVEQMRKYERDQLAAFQR